MHIPWHCQASFDIMISMAKDFERDHGLDEINIMGDFADFYWPSLHPKMPSHFKSQSGTFKDEIYICNMILDFLSETFPNSKIRYIEGNHEFRLVRYMAKKAPELFDMFDVKELLKLDKRDIEFFPFGRHQLVQCLDSPYNLRHQPFNQGKHTATGTIEKKFISLGYGHTHRKQTSTLVDGHGNEITARSLGCLIDFDAHIFDYVDHHNWAKGFEFVISTGDQFLPTYIDIKGDKRTSLVASQGGVVYESPYIKGYQGTVDDIVLPTV